MMYVAGKIYSTLEQQDGILSRGYDHRAQTFCLQLHYSHLHVEEYDCQEFACNAMFGSVNMVFKRLTNSLQCLIDKHRIRRAQNFISVLRELSFVLQWRLVKDLSFMAFFYDFLMEWRFYRNFFMRYNGKILKRKSIK